MSPRGLVDYPSREVGAFVIAPLFLMVISVPWGWWPLLFVALIWLGAAMHMFTGWLPRKRR